jgi:hypothetical protein
MMISEFAEKIISLEAQLDRQEKSHKETLFAWNQFAEVAVGEVRITLAENQVLKTALELASGIISTMPEYSGKHPDDVLGILLAQSMPLQEIDDSDGDRE